MRWRRSRPEVIAREALKDPVFSVAVTGLHSLHIDYDPGVWTRTPRPGEDRTEWAAAHLAAYTSDTGTATSAPAFAAVQAALDEAADSLVSHTADLIALPGTLPDAWSTAVLYVDLLDEELGVLEHGAPDLHVALVDVKPEGPPPAARWMPTKRQAGALLMAWDSRPDFESGRSERIVRGHRTVDVGAGHPSAHLYTGAFYADPRAFEPIVKTMLAARARRDDGTLDY